MEQESAEAIAAAGWRQVEMRELVRRGVRRSKVDEVHRDVGRSAARLQDVRLRDGIGGSGSEAVRRRKVGRDGLSGRRCGYVVHQGRASDGCFGIQDYGNLLFPQCATKEHFPSAKTLMKKEGLKKWLGEQTVAKLAESVLVLIGRRVSLENACRVPDWVSSSNRRGVDQRSDVSNKGVLRRRFA